MVSFERHSFAEQVCVAERRKACSLAPEWQAGEGWRPQRQPGLFNPPNSKASFADDVLRSIRGFSHSGGAALSCRSSTQRSAKAAILLR